MLTHFQENWITSTLAPESTYILKESNRGYLHIIQNEFKTLKVYVLENKETKNLCVGQDYNSVLKDKSGPYKEKVSQICNLLKLNSFTLK